MNDPGSQSGMDGMAQKETLNTPHKECCYIVYRYLRNKGLDSEKVSDFPLSPGLS